MLLSDKDNKISVMLASGMLGMTLVIGAVLASVPVSAEDESVVSNVSVTVTTSCTFQGIVNTAHTANIENGTVQGNIGSTTLKAFCNDNGGFSIHAIGYTDEEYGKTVLSSQAIGDSVDITTGTGTSGTSSWAMKLGASNSTAYPITLDNGFGAYSAVPATFTKVAHRDSGTDIGTSATGALLTTTYQVYVSSDQPADNYVGKVKYTMVHPSAEEPAQPRTTTAGQICYYANTSSAVGTMGCQNVASSVTLLASNFSRAGYGFAGWSDKFDYATNANAHFYGPNETITLNTADYTGENNGLSLYAVWVKSAGNLQDTTTASNICSSLTTAPTDGTANLASVSALTDQRDSNTYAIAKLADGNCWMIENLRLDKTNSDNSTGALAQGYGTSTAYGNFSGLAEPESANFRDSTTANSLYYSGTQSGTASVNIGTSSYPGYRFPRYNNANTSARASSPTANSVAMYSYGNYYSWAAAIADTTDYTSGDHNTTSICPTGWMVPLGNTSTGDITQGAADAANRVGGFSYLDRKMGGTGSSQSIAEASNRWRKWPNNFLYSGLVLGSPVSDRGSLGYYWSSTAFSSFYAYNLYFDSSSVRPGTNSYDKYRGRPVRCLAQ